MNTFGRKPTVFVSSTCYDLKQIRNDLKNTIENDLGMEALLSEYKSFPLDPSLGTVDNCLRVVKERADIFVLVIGTRYGYVNETGKSVTNLEYLAAKEKGIPVYAFIDKKLTANLPLWKSNPTMDFSSVVDNSTIFNFVDSLMNLDNIWVHEYDLANEIADRLKYQLSYLFYDALMIKKKLTSKKFSEKILSLSSKAIQIILEESDGWEYKFFFPSSNR